MTESVQTLGVWDETAIQAPPYYRMVLNADQLAEFWRRVSLTADFWADYLTLSVPETVSRDRLNREAVHSILSYLLNELFENCAKFSAGAVKTVYFASWPSDDALVFLVTNHIKPEGQPPFMTFLRDLFDGDPSELYFQRIEENAETGNTGSGLGYLTLIMDFGVRFGFRFRPVSDESVAIDVQAQVSMKRDER